MPDSSGDKLCPICDSPLQPGSKKCGFCGTDLSIFDIEVEKTEPVQPTAPATAPAPKPSMESRVREVLSAPPKPEPVPVPMTQPEPEEEPESTAASFISEPVADQKAEPLMDAEEPSVAGPVAVTETPQYFACPECGASVEIHASSCPGCGVMFADEGAEMFQCPACNTLVAIESKSCSGCGAVFVESEEEAASHEQLAQAQVDIEEPISEVRPPTTETVPWRAQGPEPARAGYEGPEVAPAEEPSVKKGLGGFGWFKKRKKDTERQEPAAQTVYGLTEVPEEPRRIPEPELEVRSPWPPPQPIARPAPASADSKAKGKELKRMVEEIKPILALANEKDIDITESKRLIDEAAEAGRDRQLEKALEFVNRSRGILMTKIDEHLASAIIQLKEEAGVAKSLGGEVSRAATYISEVERAKAAGDAEAAFVYANKASGELLPITGRYKEAKNRTASLRSLVTDCETLILDTKEARTALAEASKAFEANDFDRVELLVKQATDRLYRAIPDRVNEEMHAAKAQLIEAKMRNVNTTPMITILKSVRTLMKAGDYQQALREMKEFKEQIRKVT